MSSEQRNPTGNDEDDVVFLEEDNQRPSYQYSDEEEPLFDGNDHFGEKFNRYTFCSRCGNLLEIDTSEDFPCYRFVCPTCPFYLNITKRLVHTVVVKKSTVVEEDIIDVEKADKHRQRTEVICPECTHNEAFFYQMQTRSADEPMTNFYQCANKKCNHNWRD